MGSLGILVTILYSYRDPSKINSMFETAYVLALLITGCFGIMMSVLFALRKLGYFGDDENI